MEQLEKQEIHCHDCGKYVQFDIDVSLNGNHVLNCPNCGHEHCRVVKDGIITSDRWDSRNGEAIMITSATTTAASTFITCGTNDTSGGTFLYDSWLNTT